MVNHEVDLFGQLSVDLCNDGLHGLVRIVGDGGYRCERLLCKRLYGSFYCVACLVGFGLEFFVQQGRKVVAF